MNLRCANNYVNEVYSDTLNKKRDIIKGVKNSKRPTNVNGRYVNG